MYKQGSIYSLIIIIVLILVLFGAGYHGYRNRIYASGKSLVGVDSQEEAYRQWQVNGVRGRVLLLFDRYPHMRGLRSYKGGAQLNRSNLIEYAVIHNIIRKIYFIVPDHEWEEFRLREMVHPLREVPGIERGLFLYNLSGIPLIATTPSSLPNLPEKPIVYINTAIYDQEEAMALLSEKRIDSDIIVTNMGRGK